MAQYRAVLTIPWVSSFFNWAKDFFQGFCRRDDSGIIGYGFALSGIVMYFEAQWRENDDGSKLWYILTHTALCGWVFNNTRITRSESSIYNEWILKAPQVVRQTRNKYGPIRVSSDEYLTILTEQELNRESSTMRGDVILPSKKKIIAEQYRHILSSMALYWMVAVFARSKSVQIYYYLASRQLSATFRPCSIVAFANAKDHMRS
jgi:hypothetical protein